MTEGERVAAAYLRDAAKLVDMALGYLDVSEAPCPTCKTTQYRDRRQGRIAKEIAELPERLQRTAARIEGADPTYPGGPSAGYKAGKRKQNEEATHL